MKQYLFVFKAQPYCGNNFIILIHNVTYQKAFTAAPDAEYDGNNNDNDNSPKAER